MYQCSINVNTNFVFTICVRNNLITDQVKNGSLYNNAASDKGQDL